MGLLQKFVNGRMLVCIAVSLRNLDFALCGICGCSFIVCSDSIIKLIYFF